MRNGLSKHGRTERIRPFDFLLITGLTLAPMTSLRVWRVGPAEVLCLIWGLRSLLRPRLHKSDTLVFFARFFAALSLGMVFGWFVAPEETSLTGLLTWLYLGIIAVSLYEGLSKKTLDYNEKLFRVFSSAAILWYSFLFIYSRTVSATLFGVPLWYRGVRFSGGGTNPHQVAVMLCGLCFVFVRQILNRRMVLLNLVFMLSSIFLLSQTASSTGIMAAFLGFVICLYFILIYTFPKSRIHVAIVLTLVLLLGGLFVYNTLFDRVMAWIASDSNGLGRLALFTEFPESFIRSPILGLGPGTHGRGGEIEFHNTYLEILAASGIVGFAVFLVYTVKIFRKAIRGDWRLFPILCAMYAYGLAGFAMRRLIYWGILVFVIVIAEKRIQQQYEYGG